MRVSKNNKRDKKGNEQQVDALETNEARGKKAMVQEGVKGEEDNVLFLVGDMDNLARRSDTGQGMEKGFDKTYTKSAHFLYLLQADTRYIYLIDVAQFIHH